MTTKLEIINAMLAVNGETPVSDAGSNDPAAIQAANALDRINKKVQARGWWFNKEDILLSVSSSTGQVVLPSNTLSADPVDPNSQYIQRGTRLYDRKNNTFSINESVNTRLILKLDIDELPEVAAAYLNDKAVKEYYTDDDGDDAKIRKLADRESESFAYLQRANLANSDVNIRNSGLGRALLRETRSSTYIDSGA